MVKASVGNAAEESSKEHQLIVDSSSGCSDGNFIIGFIRRNCPEYRSADGTHSIVYERVMFFNGYWSQAGPDQRGNRHHLTAYNAARVFRDLEVFAQANGIEPS
jgi:hypothetical protein